MIVDWARNGEQIYQTKRLTLEDFADRKTTFRQEIMYIKYLQEALGFNKEQCQQEWKQIINGSAADKINDPDECKIFFNFLWGRATSPQYNKFQCAKKLDPITIYQEELDFLNALQTPLWVKQYWCAMLIYYKFQKQNLPANTVFIQRNWLASLWALSLTDSKEKRYSNLQDTIAQWQLRQGVPVMKYLVNGTLNLYHPEFICDQGHVCIQIDNIEQSAIVLTYLVNQIRCSNCGEWFTRSEHCQRTLCLKCYTDMRKQRDAQNKRKYRKNARQ